MKEDQQGGWDLAANAILRNQFLDQLQELLRGIELGREANLGIDRVSLRLSKTISTISKRRSMKS